MLMFNKRPFVRDRTHRTLPRARCDLMPNANARCADRRSRFRTQDARHQRHLMNKPAALYIKHVTKKQIAERQQHSLVVRTQRRLQLNVDRMRAANERRAGFLGD